LERTTVDENDIVTAVLSNPDAQDALRVIARIAIREVALRANSSPPVEDVTVIGDMTIDRLRHTEEKTRFGILSTLRTAAKLAPFGILTGVRSNKPRPIKDHILLKDGFDPKAAGHVRPARPGVGAHHQFSSGDYHWEKPPALGPAQFRPPLEPVPHDLAGRLAC
jgi:hypothetical protein